MHSSKWSESFVKKMFLNFLTIIKIEQNNYLFSISHMFDINEYGIYDIR